MRNALRTAALALLLAAATFAATPAAAADAFSLDLGINGGVLGTNDTRSSLFVGGAQARFHIVWIVAAEVRVSYYSDTYDVSSLGSVEVKNLPIQFSGMLYLLKFPHFGLYVLGGATHNTLMLDGQGNVQGSQTTNKWAAHAGAGLDFGLSQHFILNVDGRYVFLNVDVANLPPASSGAYKSDYWAATIGLNWKLF
jgi:hypothetical protein